MPVKRRMFFLVVYGVVPDAPSTILKITQESTTRDVIAQVNAYNILAHKYFCVYEDQGMFVLRTSSGRCSLPNRQLHVIPFDRSDLGNLPLAVNSDEIRDSVVNAIYVLHNPFSLLLL